MKETFIEIVDLLKIELDKSYFILKGKDVFVRKSKEAVGFIGTLTSVIKYYFIILSLTIISRHHIQ
ncbi:hypothetical protein [Sphingobacterium detergens]